MPPVKRLNWTPSLHNYYNGNQENSIFKMLKSRREVTKTKRKTRIIETVWDLLLDPQHCSCPRKSVRHNCSFIIDTSTKKALEEVLLANDCVVQLNNGQPCIYYERSGMDNTELTKAGRGGMVDEKALRKPWLLFNNYLPKAK